MSEPKRRALTGYSVETILARLGKAGTAVQGDDPRLTDTRQPRTHKQSHIAGPDALTPADIGAAPEDHTHPGPGQAELEELIERLRFAEPQDLGALSAAPTIPFDAHATCVGSVGDHAEVDIALTPPSAGAGCILELTATSDVHVALPMMRWVGSSVWSGEMTGGDEIWIGLTYMGAALGWRGVWASLSTTDQPAPAVPGSDVSISATGFTALSSEATNLQLFAAAVDDAIHALRTNLFSVPEPLGTALSGAVDVPFNAHRSATGTLTGAVTLTLTPPTGSQVCKLILIEDDTGGHARTFASSAPIRIVSGGASTAANSVTHYVCSYDGADIGWLIQAISGDLQA